MNRRLALLTGAAVAAGAAGVGVGWWRSRAGADAPVWALRFDTLAGTPLAMAALRGKPLLLNFWATWCPPCVRELPMLDQFHREQQARGWQVLGLAVDKAEPVRQFLAQRPVGFSIALADVDGVALSRQLGNAGGALPFTVVFDGAGRVAQRKLGVLTPEDLAQWAAAVH